MLAAVKLIGAVPAGEFVAVSSDFVQPATVLLTVAAVPLIVALLRATSRMPVAVLRGPVLVLALVALPLSLWASAFPVTVSMPRAAVLVWSMALALWVGTWDRRFPFRNTKNALLLSLAAAMGVVLAIHPGLLPNERAGSVAPLVVLLLAWHLPLPPPWAAAKGDSDDATSSLAWWWWVAVTASLMAVVVMTGSRGGLLALGTGLATVMLLVVEKKALRFRVLVAGGAAVVVALLLLHLAGVDPLARFLLDGSPQGWRWDVVLTGRPRIWDRAIHMLADGGLTGVGLGMFGVVAREVYALPLGSGPLEDAHSLPLQVGLDFGVIGIVVWSIIVGATVRQAWRGLMATERGKPERWRAAGLCGAIVATVAFNLADAVAPGSIAGMGSWLLVGAVFAQASADPTPVPSVARVSIRGWRRGLLVGSSGMVLIVCGVALRPALRLDLIGRDAVQAVLHQDRAGLRSVHSRLAQLTHDTPQLCRARWLEGRVLAALGDARRDDAWLRLAACNPGRVPLVAAVAPNDRLLAAQVVATRPELAVAHLWFARSLGKQPQGADRAAAVRAFRRGLTLDPNDGYAWRQLGDLLVEHDLRAAMASYAASCRHGDPGANGCLLAGAVARYLGEVDLAIGYYRASRWPPARSRAEALERDRR